MSPTSKAQYQPVVQLLERLAPLWQERMGLSHYEIEHVFLDSYDGEGSIDDFQTTAVTEVRWNYLEAKVKWYLPSAVRHTDDHLEQTMVHELAHVLLSPEQALLDHELERIGVHEALTDPELDQMQALMYERMELATEQTARALYRAWAHA